MKKVSFSGKPSGLPAPATVDDWVSSREASGREATKRFTIDVPVSLHKRVKTRCAIENLVMADVMRELLERRFPAPGGGEGEGSRGHD